MRQTLLWTLLAGLVPNITAIDLAERSANPRVVGLDIERQQIPNIIEYEKARLRRRQNTVEEVLDNEQSLYFANLTLGTPAQQLRLHIDTGSSDLWVNTANSTLCQSRAGRCIGGTYDPSQSSSFKVVNALFNISYVDGSAAVGNYVTDTLSFGGTTLDSFQFGVGLRSTSIQGVLGIGYTANEVQVVNGRSQAYPNLPLALKNAGRINRNAYSLWLNDLDASTGTILFGGVNTAKYQGTLETVPVYRSGRTASYSQFIVALSSFGLNGSSFSSSNLPSPVLLDSGSTISRLPDDIVDVLYTRMGIQYDESAEVGIGLCEMANYNGYLEFGFSGVNIQVPFNELFLDLGTDSRGRPYTINGKAACLFGIAPSLGIIPILGDTFLRSAYVVYDLDRNEISLAQTVYNSTTNNVVEIASGTAPIPNATPAPSTIVSISLGTATDGARLGAATGSLTATITAASGSGTSSATRVSTTGSTSASSSRASSGASSGASSANKAYQTKAPYLVGAMMAGAGLLL